MLRRNVLIFHQAALGDFVITWPLALALGRTFAQSRVLYVTGGQKGKLAQDLLGLESIEAESGWHHLYSTTPALPEHALRWLDGAQMIVSFVSNGSDIWSQNVRQLAPEATLICLQVPRHTAVEVSPEVISLAPNLAGHVTLEILQQLYPWPIVQIAMSQMLNAVCQRGIGTRATAGNAIVIHPGAGHPEKCWPLANFVALIQRLRQEYPQRPIYVLLGEVELDRCSASDIQMLHSVAEVVQPAALSDLAIQLRHATAFIGHDSGPAHLAAMLGVPTIALFGNDPRRWRPLGPRVHTLDSQPIGQITPQSVLESLMQFNE